MKHAEQLLPVIDRLLKKEKMKLRDIDAFLISRGPGSFTGLRIGFATLRGFLTIQPKPCYGASSLDIIAAGIKLKKEDRKELTVCLDAKRNRLYTRAYAHRNGVWIPRGKVRVALFDEMARELSVNHLVAGDGSKKISAAGHTILPEKNWAPRASTLIELFEAKSPLIKPLKHPKDLLPVYLRRSEPEEKLAEAKKHG